MRINRVNNWPSLLSQCGLWYITAYQSQPFLLTVKLFCSFFLSTERMEGGQTWCIQKESCPLCTEKPRDGIWVIQSASSFMFSGYVFLTNWNQNLHNWILFLLGYTTLKLHFSAAHCKRPGCIEEANFLALKRQTLFDWSHQWHFFTVLCRAFQQVSNWNQLGTVSCTLPSCRQPRPAPAGTDWLLWLQQNITVTTKADSKPPSKCQLKKKKKVK